MGKGRRSGNDDPRRHTAIVGDVPTMWQKLAWDVDQFDRIQRDFPDIPEPLAFAAINVCISAASLMDWTVGKAVLTLIKAGPKAARTFANTGRAAAKANPLMAGLTVGWAVGSTGWIVWNAQSFNLAAYRLIMSRDGLGEEQETNMA